MFESCGIGSMETEGLRRCSFCCVGDWCSRRLYGSNIWLWRISWSRMPVLQLTYWLRSASDERVLIPLNDFSIAIVVTRNHVRTVSVMSGGKGKGIGKGMMGENSRVCL